MTMLAMSMMKVQDVLQAGDIETVSAARVRVNQPAMLRHSSRRLE